MKKIIVFATVALLTSCASVSKDMTLVSGNAPTTELLIYLPSTFHIGGHSMYVGKENKYFVNLGGDEYAIIKIDSGTYKFQVKADGSPVSELNIALLPNEKVCLEGKPNPKAYGAFAVPILANMVPTFVLEKVDCPQDQFFQKYEQVSNS